MSNGTKTMAEQYDANRKKEQVSVNASDKGTATDPNMSMADQYDAFREQQEIVNPFQQPGIQSTVSGFDLDEYTHYVKNIRSIDNIEVQRAYGQGWGEQLGGALVQAGGSIVGDTISGIGAIGEIVSYIWDDNRDFNNAMMRVGDAIGEGAREAAPIYRTDPNKAFDMGDFGWWTSMFPSMVSTVSAMIPGYGVVKGIGMLGKAARLAKFGKGLAKAAKAVDGVSDFTKAASKTLIAASTSRNAENMREAADVYQQGYAQTLEDLQNEESRKRIEGGWAYDDAKNFYGKNKLSDEEIAGYIASKGAQRTYNANWSNIGFDIAQAALPFFKGVRGLSRLGTTSKGLAKAQNLAAKGTEKLSRAQRFKLTMNPYTSVLGGSLTEGVEEAVNFIGGAEGVAFMEQMKGNVVDPFQLRMKDYLSDGHLYEAAVLGIAGGAMFSGATRFATKDQRKKSQEGRIAEIQKRGADTAEMYAKIQEIQKDETKSDTQKQIEIDGVIDQVAYLNGIRAAVNGNVGLAMEEYNSENFKQKILESGTTEEEFERVNKRVKERIQYAEQMYGKYRGNPLTAVDLDDDTKAHINALKLQNAGAIDQFNKAKKSYKDAYQNELNSVPDKAKNDDNFENNIELAAIEEIRAKNAVEAEQVAQMKYFLALQEGRSKEEAKALADEHRESVREIGAELDKRAEELRAEGAVADKSRKSLVDLKAGELRNESLELWTDKKQQRLDEESKQREIDEQRKADSKRAAAKAKKEALASIEKDDISDEDLNELKKNDPDPDVRKAAKEKLDKVRKNRKNSKRAAQAKGEQKGTPTHGNNTPTPAQGSPTQQQNSTPSPDSGSPTTDDPMSPYQRIMQSRGESPTPGKPSSVPTQAPDDASLPVTGDQAQGTAEAEVEQIISILNDPTMDMDAKLDELVRQGKVQTFDGEALVGLDNAGRDAIYFVINGAIIPMYRSKTGEDGKGAGNWYPFFYSTTNWVVKAPGTMSDVFGNPALKSLQKQLNKNFKYDSPKSSKQISNQESIETVLEFTEAEAFGLEVGPGFTDLNNYQAILGMLSDWQSKLGPISTKGLIKHLDNLNKKVQESQNTKEFKEDYNKQVKELQKVVREFNKLNPGQSFDSVAPTSSNSVPSKPDVADDAPITPPDGSSSEPSTVQGNVMSPPGSPSPTPPAGGPTPSTRVPGQGVPGTGNVRDDVSSGLVPNDVGTTKTSYTFEGDQFNVTVNPIDKDGNRESDPDKIVEYEVNVSNLNNEGLKQDNPALRKTFKTLEEAVKYGNTYVKADPVSKRAAQKIAVPGTSVRVPGTKSPSRPVNIPSAPPTGDGTTSGNPTKSDGSPIDNPVDSGVDSEGNPVIEIEVRNKGLIDVFNEIAGIETQPGIRGFFSKVKAVTQALIDAYKGDVKIFQPGTILESLEALSDLVPGDTLTIKRIETKTGEPILAIYSGDTEIGLVSTPSKRAKVNKNRVNKIPGIDAHYQAQYNAISNALDASPNGEVTVTISDLKGGNKVSTNVPSQISEDFSDNIEEFGFVMSTKASNHTELDSPNSLKGESVTASKVNNADQQYSPEGVYVLVPTFGGQLMPVKVTMGNAKDAGIGPDVFMSILNALNNPGTDTAQGIIKGLEQNFVTGKNGIQSTKDGIKFRYFKSVDEDFKGNELVEVTAVKNSDGTYDIVQKFPDGSTQTSSNLSANQLENELNNFTDSIPLRIDKKLLNTTEEYNFNGRTYNNYNEFVAQNATHNLGYTLLPSGKKLWVSPYSAGKVGVDVGYAPGVTLKIRVPGKKSKTTAPDLPKVQAVKNKTSKSSGTKTTKTNVDNQHDIDFGDPLGLGMSSTLGEFNDNRSPVDLDKMEVEWREMFPNVPFVRVEGLIKNGGQLAFGLFTESAVYLSTNALPGTHYHEAFHTAMHLYLPEKRRAQIYKEGRALLSNMSDAQFAKEMKRLGIKADKVSDLSNLQVEEYLAEKFRSGMIAGEINPNVPAKTAIGKFFQTLIRFIKDFVGINRGKMYEQLFRDIKGGRFNYEPTAEMRSHAKNLQLNLRVPGYTSAEKTEAVRATAVLMNTAYNDILSNWDKITAKNPEAKFEQEVKRRTQAYLQLYVNKAFEAERNGTIGPNAEALMKAIDSFETTEDGPGIYDETKREYKSKFNRDIDKVSRILGNKQTLTDQEADLDTDEEFMSIEEMMELNSGMLIRNWDDSASEYDKKKNASALVRSTILTSPRLSSFTFAEYGGDQNIPIAADQDRSSVFGTVDFLDFDLTYNYMSSHLAGVKTTEELLAKMLKLTRAFPSIGGIYLKLRTNPQLAAAFVNEFQGQVVPIVRHTLVNGNIVHQHLNINDASYSWASNWRNSNSQVGENVPKVDVSRVKKLAKDKNYTALAEYFETILDASGISMSEGQTNFMSTYLGMEIEHSVAEGTSDRFIANLLDTVSQIAASSNQEEASMGPFFELANILSMYDIRIAQRTFRSGANTNMQGVIGRNPIGDFFQMIADPTRDQELLEHLSNLYNDPRARESEWMKRLVKKNENGQLVLRNDPASLNWRRSFTYSLDAGFEKRGGSGNKASKITDRDFDALELMSFLEGVDNNNSEGSEGRVAINPVITPNNMQFNVNTPISDLEDTSVEGAEPVLGLKSQIRRAFFAEIEAMNKAFNAYMYVDGDGNIQLKEGVTPPIHSVVDGNGKHVDENGNLLGNIFKSQIFPGLEEDYFDPVNGAFVKQSEVQNFFDNKIVKETLNGEVNKTIKHIQEVNKTHSGMLPYGDDANNEDVRLDAERFTYYKMLHNINMASFFQGAASDHKNVPDVFKRSNNASLVGTNIDESQIPAERRGGVRVMTGPDILRTAASAEGGVDAPMYTPLVDAFMKTGLNAKQAAAKAKEYLSKYTNIEAHNAQGYITLDRYEDIIRGRGKWNAEWDKTFKAAKEGNLDGAQLREFLVPIKGFFSVQKLNPDTGLMEQHMIKYSAMPLIPQVMDKAPGLKTLHDSMKEQGADEYVPHTAYKLGAPVNPEAATNPKEFNADILNQLPISVLPHSSYRILQDVPAKLINAKTSFGAQISKLIISNINPKATYDVNGESVTGQELIDNYQELVSKYIEENKKRMFKEMNIVQQSDGSYLLKDFKKVANRIKKSLGTEASDIILESLEVDEAGRFVIPMYHPGTQAKIESVFTSMFTKGMINLKVPGTGAVEASSVGFDGTEYRRPTLKFNEKGGLDYAEIYLPRHMAEEFDGKTFEEIERDTPGMLEMLGFRIPTESKSTSATLKVIGFLPDSMANTVVVPDEFVTMMGSDFDLDKLMIQFRTKNASTSNDILDMMSAVLKSPEHLIEVLSPQEPDPLKDAAKKASVSEELTLPYAHSTKRIMRSRDKVGQAMLGIAANFNSLLPVAQVTSMYLAKPIKIQYPASEKSMLIGLYGADAVKDVKGKKLVEVEHRYIGKPRESGSFLAKDGEMVTTNAKQFVGAAADNTKDPVFDMFNGNAATMSSIMTMTSVGIPYDITFNLMTVPMIQDFANITLANRGVGGEFVTNKVYGYLVTDLAKQLGEIGYISEELSQAEYDGMKQLVEAIQEEKGIKNLGTYVPLSLTNLKQLKNEHALLMEQHADIMSRESTEDISAELRDWNNKRAMNLLKQGSLLAQFQEIKKSGDALNDATQAFKTDNTNVGPTFTNAQNTIERVNALGDKTSLILIDGVPAARKVYPRHFKEEGSSAYPILEAAFEAHVLADSISKELLPSESEDARDFLSRLRDEQNLLRYGQENIVKAFFNRAFIHHHSPFLHNADPNRVVGKDKKMSNLSKPLDMDTFMNLSAAEKLQYLKLHKKDSLPFGDPMHIVGRLLPKPAKGKQNNNLQVIDFDNTPDVDIINSLSETLEDMFFSDDPYIAETAKDLVRYNFFTKGFAFGGRSFGGVISTRILQDSIYNGLPTNFTGEQDFLTDGLYEDFISFNLDSLRLKSLGKEGMTISPDRQIITYEDQVTDESTPLVAKRIVNSFVNQVPTKKTLYYRLNSSLDAPVEYVRLTTDSVPGEYMPFNSSATESDTTVDTQKSKLAYRNKEDSGTTKSKVQMLRENFKSIGIDVDVVLDPTLQENAKVEGTGPGSARITINPNSTFSDTVIHEFGHVYVDLLGVNHPLVRQAINQLKDTQLWKDVSKAYPELSGNALAKEVLVTAMGREGAEIYNDTRKQSKWRTLLNKIFRAIGKLFGVEPNAARELSRQMLSNKMQRQFTGSISETAQFQKRARNLNQFVENKKLKLKRIVEEYGERASDVETLFETFDSFEEDVKGIEFLRAEENVADIIVKTKVELDAMVEFLDGDMNNLETEEEKVYYYEFIHNSTVTLSAFSDLTQLDKSWAGDDKILQEVIEDLQSYASEIDSLLTRLAEQRRELIADAVKEYVTNPELQEDILDIFEPNSERKNDISNYDEGSIQLALDALGDTNVPLVGAAVKMYKSEQEVSKIETQQLVQDWEKFAEENEDVLESLFEVDAAGNRTGRWVEEGTPQHAALMRDPKKAKAYEYVMNLMTELTEHTNHYFFEKGFIPAVPTENLNDVWKRIRSTKKEDINESIKVDENNNVIGVVPLAYAQFITSEDTEYLEIDEENDTEEEIKEKKAENRRRKEAAHAKLIDYNIKDTMKLFINTSMKHKFKTSVETKMKLIGEEVASMEFIKSEGAIDRIASVAKGEETKVKIQGRDSNIFEHYQHFMRMAFYEDFDQSSEMASKIARYLQNYMSVTGIGFNPYSALNNRVYGGIQLAIEAAAGEHFGKAEYAEAKKLYNENSITIMANRKSARGKNKVDAIIKTLDVLQSQDELAKRKGGPQRSALEKLAYVQNAAFALQHAGEHVMQNQALLAMMLKQQVVKGGKEMSLFEAIEFDESTGKIVIPDGITAIDFNGNEVSVDKKYMARFKTKVLAVNQHLHGIYSKEDAGTIQRYALGRLAMQFRKWARPGWNKRFGSRWGKSYWNERRESLDEGMYFTTYNLIKDIVKDGEKLGRNFKVYYNTLSPQQKANVKRTAVEAAYLAGVSALAMLLANMDLDDEDDGYFESRLKASLIYQVDRTITELKTYTPWYGWFNEGKKLLASPIPGLSRLETAWKLLGHTFYTMPFADQEELYFKGGRYYGESKFRIWSRSLLPGFAQFDKWQFIQNNARYYKLYD